MTEEEFMKQWPIKQWIKFLSKKGSTRVSTDRLIDCVPDHYIYELYLNFL